MICEPSRKRKNRGWIRSKDFWAYPKQVGDCLVFPGYYDRGGYGRIRAGGCPFLAHRFAWILAHGEIPTGMLVCHKCDNPPCVRRDHLFLTDHAGNMGDKVRKGRAWTGRAKLSECDVREIRRRSAAGESGRSLSRSFGVGETTIRDIRHGKIWAWLK